MGTVEYAVFLDQNGNQNDTAININDLPNELLMFIFSLVDSESIQVVEKVCRRWQCLAMTASVWDKMKLILCMKNYKQIKENILPKVASNLKVIKLHYFKMYMQIREPLTKFCPNITHMEIIISQIDCCIFDDLKSWPHLKYLSFRNSLIMREIHENEERTYVFHLPFDNLPKLETVILSNFALTSSSLDSMLSCVHLNEINIEKMKNIPSSFLENLLASKKHILKAFSVYGDTLTDYTMKLISQCTALYLLHITTCKSLFDSSLLHLTRLKTLRSLKLRHGYFSENALINYFSSNVFQKLTYLSLSRCMHVTMQVTMLIKKNAPALTEVSFYQCPFVLDKSFDRSEIENLFSILILLD